MVRVTACTNTASHLCPVNSAGICPEEKEKIRLLHNHLVNMPHSWLQFTAGYACVCQCFKISLSLWT